MACGRAAVVDRRAGSAQLSVGEEWFVMCHSHVVRAQEAVCRSGRRARVCASTSVTSFEDEEGGTGSRRAAGAELRIISTFAVAVSPSSKHLTRQI